MEKQKKRRGDRRDGRLLRELDSLHFITGIIYPNRCDNEAYISLRVDLTAMNEYLAGLNETETEFPYTMFHIVVAALIKTITLRPKLNRFIVNSNFYQRNEAQPGGFLPAGCAPIHPQPGDGVPQREGGLLHGEHGYS